MEQVIWLLQGNIRNQFSLEQMRTALEVLNTKFVEVSLAPFVDDIPKIELPDDSANIVCWGPSFVPRALKHPHLMPGIWYDPIAFRWSTCRNVWAGAMLSPDGQVAPFKDAVSNLSGTPVFIRPDEDNKAFAGGVFDKNNPPQLQGPFDEHTPVVVAPVQSVEDEWRFVIVGGRIVASTSYRISGRPNIQGLVPREAIDLAEKASSRWCPAEVFCLDIGHAGKRYGIVEANCFNASRLYGADIVKVVKGVHDKLSSA